MARIFRDFLARESLSFLPGVAGWYISIAILALLHARRIDSLHQAVNQEIEILFVALKELSRFWHSSNMFLVGFDNLLSKNHPGDKADEEGTRNSTSDCRSGASALTDLTAVEGINYLDFFPFASAETSQLFQVLLTENPPAVFPQIEWPTDLSTQLQDLFGQQYDGFDLEPLIL